MPSSYKQEELKAKDRRRGVTEQAEKPSGAAKRKKARGDVAIEYCCHFCLLTERGWSVWGRYRDHKTAEQALAVLQRKYGGEKPLFSFRIASPTLRADPTKGEPNDRQENPEAA